MQRTLLKPMAWMMALLLTMSASGQRNVDLSPARWPAGEYEQFMKAQGELRTEAGFATGTNGAGTVSYNGIAARAGLEALKQGGNALDAAMTTAVTQVAVTAGAPIGEYQIQTNQPPNAGGVNLIEAQNLAIASGLAAETHWTKSAASFRKALEITQMMNLNFMPEAALKQMYPGMDLSPAARTTLKYAEELWKRMQAGAKPYRFALPPKHSDDVVAIDKQGNIAAITHSINCVDWGRTAINIDGISIGDPGSYQQALIARIKPGSRLPAPTETGILFKNGQPVLGFASMGSGLHQRTFQCLLNITRFGMSVDEAINIPDFFLPGADPKNGTLTVYVPKGKFSKAVLDELGYAYKEFDAGESRFGGEGLWVGISRDPKTGTLRAASHNRNNSAAVAW